MNSFFAINNGNPRKWHVMEIALAVFIIYFSARGVVVAEPRSIKAAPLSVGEIVSELSDSGIKNVEFRLQKNADVLWPLNGIRIDIREFAVKGGNKSLGSVSFGVNGREFKCEPVADQNSNESTGNSPPNTNQCYFIGTKFQFWASAIGGCLLVLFL